MSFLARLRTVAQTIGLLRTATDQQLQSIGAQAFERVKVADLILRGESLRYDNGAMVLEITDAVIRHECGFLNYADALAFVNGLQPAVQSVFTLGSAIPYSQSADHYRLSGWVWSVYPVRCNAYYYDWAEGRARAVIDLGPVESRV
jgi:hypothetical protein